MLDDPKAHTFFLGDFEPMCRDVLPADYRRAAADVPIVHTVAIEAECADDQKVEEARWLAALGDKQGMPSAIVAGAVFHQPGVGETLRQLARIPSVRSIRCKPRTRSTPDASLGTEAGTLADPQWQRGFRQLEQHGLGWDLRLPYWHLAEAADLVAGFPGIPVVVEHTGLPLSRSPQALTVWRDGMSKLARSGHIFCKLSCLLRPGTPWDRTSNELVIREAIEIFGAHRCMFATNYPVDALQIPMRAMLEAYREITTPLGIETQRQLFHDTAVAFYRLDAAGTKSGRVSPDRASSTSP